MLKFVLLNRINSVFFSSFILFLFVGGCVFSEGYVSDHSFYIRFDKRVNGRVANQDLSVFRAPARIYFYVTPRCGN